MRDADAVAVAVLVRDRDAWQTLALQAIGVLRTCTPLMPRPGDHKQQIDDIERSLLLQVMRDCDGNHMEAARRLGLAYKTLRYKLYGHEKISAAREDVASV